MSSPSPPQHSTNLTGNHAGSVKAPASLNNKAVFEGGGFAVNLPKGGGAIRGIDEKINVDAHRGSARLTVPLPVNPVRGGVGPELSMDYESSAGNGPLGVGWNVKAPSIVRRTDKGIPRYEDDSDSDCFLAPGTDELVRITDNQGNSIVRYHSPDGGLLVSAPADEFYEVRPYRSRVDNACDRIEWWRRMAFSPSHSQSRGAASSFRSASCTSQFVPVCC